MKILFICLGNICRSPLAEEVFRQKVKSTGRVADFPTIDSAGMIDYHEGELPDHRMRQQAAARGYALTHHSRPMTAEDFRLYRSHGCRQHPPTAREMPNSRIDEQGGVALRLSHSASWFHVYSRPLLRHFGWFWPRDWPLRGCLRAFAHKIIIGR